MSERFRVRPPVGACLFWGIAAWHLAIAITAASAFVLNPTGEYAWFALRRLGWTATFGYVGWLIYENHRLRSTPPWRAAVDLTSQGWARGWADRDRVAQADAKRAAATETEDSP